MNGLSKYVVGVLFFGCGVMPSKGMDITVRPHGSTEDFKVPEKVYQQMGTLKNLVADSQEMGFNGTIPLPDVTSETWKNMQQAVEPVLKDISADPTRSQIYQATDRLQHSLLDYFKNKPRSIDSMTASLRGIASMVASLKAADYLESPLWLNAIAKALGLHLTQSPAVLKQVVTSKNLEGLLELPLQLKEPLKNEILTLNQGAVEYFYMPDSLPEKNKKVITPNNVVAYELLFNRAEDKLFIAKNAGVVEEWDIAQSKLLHTFNSYSSAEAAPKNWFVTMAVSPDDSTLVTDGDRNTIQVWDLETKQVKQVLQGHAEPIRTVVFSPDNSKLASAANDNTIRLWDMNSGAETKILKNAYNVLPMTFSADGKQLAYGTQDKIVCVWDIEQGGVKRIENPDLSISEQLQFTHDGATLVSRSGSSKIFIWHGNNGKPIQISDERRFISFAVSEDGMLLKTIARDGAILLWNMNDGSLVRTVANQDIQGTAVFSNFGRLYAAHKWKENPVVVKPLYNPVHIPDPATKQLMTIPLELFLQKHLTLEQALLITHAYHNKITKQQLPVALCDATEGEQLKAAYEQLPSPLKERVQPELQFKNSLFCTVKSFLTGRASASK